MMLYLTYSGYINNYSNNGGISSLEFGLYLKRQKRYNGTRGSVATSQLLVPEFDPKLKMFFMLSC